MTWEPDYVDATELEDFVRVNADNPYVATYGTAAARSIDGHCNRQFGRFETAVPFTYPAHNAVRMRDGRWLVATDDIPDTPTSVTVDGVSTALGADGWVLWPLNAQAKGRPATGILLADRPYGDIVVTDRFGWLSVPAAVTAAVWLQVNRWNVRRESPYGTAGEPSEGSEVRLTAVLDPDVRTLLSGPGIIRKRMPR